MAGLTIRGYARYRGVSHTSVRKALATGRITLSPDGTIDPQVADRQWAEATDQSKPRNSVSGKPKMRKSSGEPPEDAELEERPAQLPEEDEMPWLGSSYAAARAARETYLARLAKLEFEQRSGKLIEAAQVEREAFSVGRRVRERLLSVAARLAPVIAGMADVDDCYKLLEKEMFEVCDELSKPERAAEEE